MPSYGGAHGPDGSKKSGDQGQGTRDRDGGQTGGFGGRNAGRDNPFDARFKNQRYSQTPGIARPATAGNIATAVGGLLPGGGLVNAARAMLKGTMDPYSGPSMPHTNFSYDNKGMASQAPNPATKLLLNPAQQAGLNKVPQLIPSSAPNMSQLFAQAFTPRYMPGSKTSIYSGT